MIKLQFREILRYVKRNKIELRSGAVLWEYPIMCALGTIAHSDGLKDHMYPWLKEQTKETKKNLLSLEAGFEGYNFSKIHRDIYYRIGERLRNYAIKEGTY